jgi:hypothetical protein
METLSNKSVLFYFHPFRVVDPENQRILLQPDWKEAESPPMMGLQVAPDSTVHLKYFSKTKREKFLCIASSMSVME